MELIQDEHGNKIRIEDNGNCFLELATEKRARLIGIMRNDGVFMKKATHIFEKLNAFGFCYSLIDHLKPLYIIVYYDGSRYDLPMEKFKDNMKFLNFKKQGFERQVFVPLGVWKKD